MLNVGGTTVGAIEGVTETAKICFSALIGGSFACFITACIAGMLI